MDDANQGSERCWVEGSCIEAEEEPQDTTIRTYENAVTLYEDKQYYPDAEDVGVERAFEAKVFKGAEVVVQEEDAQDIKEPLIKPLNHQVFSILEKSIPETKVRVRSSAKR